MRVPYVHICDYASISREGKLSAMGIFDQIFVPSMPAMHPLLYLAFAIELVPSELGSPFKIRIQLADADGKVMMMSEGNVRFDGEPHGHQTLRVPQIFGMGGIPFSVPSQYSFDIFINGDLKAQAPFRVAIGQVPLSGGESSK